MAVLYFGTTKELSPDAKVLKKDIYGKCSAPDAVFDFLRNQLKKDPVAHHSHEGQAATSSKKSSTSSQEPGPSSGSGKTPHLVQRTPPHVDGKVPKWFKAGK